MPGVPAEEVKTPRGSALPLVTTVGCSHRLHVSPQISYVEVLTPNVMGFEGGAHGR